MMKQILLYVVMSSSLFAIGASAQQVKVQCPDPQAISYMNKPTSTLWSKKEFPGANHDQYVMNYQTICTTNITENQTGPLPRGREFDELVFDKILRPSHGPKAKKLISGPELIGNGFHKSVYKITTRTGSDAGDNATIAAASAKGGAPAAQANAPQSIDYEIDMTVTLITNDVDQWIIDWHANNQFCNGDVCPDNERHNIRVLNGNLEGDAKYAANLEELQVGIEITKAPGTGTYVAKMTGLTRINNPTKNLFFAIANKSVIHADARAKQKLVERAGWQVNELLGQTILANNAAPKLTKSRNTFTNASSKPH